MANKLAKVRTLQDWIYNPTPEETICKNPFRDTLTRVWRGPTFLDPYGQLDDSDNNVKLAKLIMADLILFDGTTVYVREDYELIPVSDAPDLLAFYMHSDLGTAHKCSSLLQSELMGRRPVTDGKVKQDMIILEQEDGERSYVDLKTLDVTDPIPDGTYAEYGIGYPDMDTFDALATYCSLVNEALQEEFFVEKALMYPFTQKIREKSFNIVGGGGNGKSMFMGILKALYGDRAITDSPQPNFSGHSAGKIAYNFIGKKVVTFNDVNKPDAQFMEWQKRMITGNLEVKTPSGDWLSVPSSATFYLESNHVPELLNNNAHRRRFIIREFPETFMLANEMSSEMLDKIGDNSSLSAADVVNYLLVMKPQIADWTTFARTSEQ